MRRSGCAGCLHRYRPENRSLAALLQAHGSQTRHLGGEGGSGDARCRNSDFGSALDDPTLAKFPLSREERSRFDGAIRLIHRAGGAKGLVLLDAVQGTAHCHSPFVFTMDAGSPRPLNTPKPGDPFELCLHGGVALGAASVGSGDASIFYAQTTNDSLEVDELKVFPFREGALTESCSISANYEFVYETAERVCDAPDVCAAFSARAAEWAKAFHATEGAMSDPSLAPLAEDAPLPEPGDFPALGVKNSKLLSQPLRFSDPDRWFAVKGDPRVDVLRVGLAEGPANVANWSAYTLAALYKSGQPVASFVVEKRRSAFKSLSVRDPGQ